MFELLCPGLMFGRRVDFHVDCVATYEGKQSLPEQPLLSRAYLVEQLILV